MRPGFGVRLAAGLVDGLVGLLLGLILSGNVGWFFAERAVVTLRIGSPGTIWKGPLPMMLGIGGPLVYALPLAMLLVFMAEPLAGGTPGKLLLGLKTSTEGGAHPSPGRIWTRTAIKTSIFWGLTLALLLGSWQVAVAALLCGAVVLVGFLGALGPSGRTLHDRLTRTITVYRRTGTGLRRAEDIPSRPAPT